MRLSCNFPVILATIGFLFFGGITTIAQNDYLKYSTSNFPGKEGQEVGFDYPWFGNLLMFLAMSLVGFGWAYQARKAKREKILYGGVQDTFTEFSTEVTNTNVDSSSSDISDVLETFRPKKNAGPQTCSQRFMQNPWGVLIISTIFDLLASGLGSVALSNVCNVPPSIFQMLQGAIIVFTALLSRCFLKRKTTGQQKLAICICTAGLIVIAVASYLADIYFPEDAPRSPTPSPDDPSNPSNASSSLLQQYMSQHGISAIEYRRAVKDLILRFFLKPHERKRLGIATYQAVVKYINGTVSVMDADILKKSLESNVSLGAAIATSTTRDGTSGSTARNTMLIIGIVLTLSSQLIYAGQFVVEEYTMSRISAMPTQVVCIEGIYGLILSVCLVFPILAAAKIENDFDAFIFIKAKPTILIPMAIFFLAVAFYNGFGQTITKLISANHRTILESLRALVVWIFALIERAIYGKPWGEGLYGWTSGIEAAGFVILLLGSMTFYSIIRCKCFKDQPAPKSSNKFTELMEETSMAPYENIYSETVTSETFTSEPMSSSY